MKRSGLATLLVRRLGVIVAPLLVVAGCASDRDAGSTGTAANVEPTSEAGDETPSSSAPTSAAPTTALVATDSSNTAPAVPESTVPATEATAPAVEFGDADAIVTEFVADEGLNGAGLVIVHRDLGVIHEQYWGEFGPDRISLVASSSKMVTAGVLLALQDRGVLDIDTPIAEYVDWADGNPEITVAQLLSNSSGLVGLLPDPGYGPYICQFVADGTLQDCAANIFTASGDDADIVAPDTEFRYGGAQWQVAGAVAEAVSGQTWDELIEEIYVEPCGLATLAYNNHFLQVEGGFTYPQAFDGDPSILAATDNPNMEGGMYVTPTDYSKLLLMHLREGRCGETQVLSPEALATMHADRIGAVYGGEGFAGTGYGMGWWVDKATGRISDGGAYGSIPWLDLADGYGAYLVIERDNPTGSALAAQLYDVVEQAVLASV